MTKTVRNDKGIGGGAIHIVSHNNDDIWHYSLLTPANANRDYGLTTTTGQPYQEQFANKSDALALIPEEYHVSSGAKEPDELN